MRRLRQARGNGALADTAEKQALEKLRENLAPFHVDMEIALITSGDSKMPPEAGQCVKDGIAWFKEDRMERACELWSRAAELQPEGCAIPYLQGVCAEVGGRQEEALAFCNTADSRTKKPSKEIASAISRVSTKIVNREKLWKCL